MRYTMKVKQLDRILCEVFDAVFSETDAEILKNYSRDIAEELIKYRIQIDETTREKRDKWIMHPLLILPFALILELILGKLINR